jgi:hypothetical protein
MSEKQYEAIVGETIVRHEYDVDAFQLIDELLIKITEQNFTTDKVQVIKENLILAENMMVERISTHYPEIIDAQKKRHYIIPSLHNEYNDYLAYKLLVIDPYRIPSLLSYQSKLFLGNDYAAKGSFIGLIEFMTYNRVKSFNFLDGELRRERILKWVEDNRYFDFEDNSQIREEHGFLITDPKLSQVLFENIKLITPNSRHEDLYFLLSENRAPKMPIPLAANKTQIAELFKRIKYNGACKLDNIVLAKVIVRFFSSMNKKKQVLELNESSVYDVIRRFKSEPSIGTLLFEHVVEYKKQNERKDVVDPSN